MLFRAPSARQVSLGLAALRIAAGTIFMRHGYQKLFVMGVSGVTGFFTQVGVPVPGVFAVLIMLLEFFGAIALVSGFLTRPVALFFVLDMLGAILFVQMKNGFSHYELEFLLLGSSVALLLAGGGRFSIDALIADRQAGSAGPQSATSSR